VEVLRENQDLGLLVDAVDGAAETLRLCCRREEEIGRGVKVVRCSMMVGSGVSFSRSTEEGGVRPRRTGADSPSKRPPRNFIEVWRGRSERWGGEVVVLSGEEDGRWAAYEIDDFSRECRIVPDRVNDEDAFINRDPRPCRRGEDEDVEEFDVVVDGFGLFGGGLRS
jgi:hypothetical protein